MSTITAKVAVMMGGDSAEREISLLSGNAVLHSLQKSGINAHAFDPANNSIADLQNQHFSTAVLMTHGARGEDGILQGMLEFLRIPYTGSGVLASSLAMDKYRTKLIWEHFKIPVPAGQYVHKKDLANFKLSIDLPVVVKPVNGGSTLGVTKVYNIQDLDAAINNAFVYDVAILIEHMVIGDEFSITVCEAVAYPIVKIIATDANYDYNNKYFTDTTQYICPYNLGVLQSIVEKYAIDAYTAVGARGIARLDFMLDQNQQIFFLEINTLPGMTNHSLVPMSYKANNINFDQLCLLILNHAKLGE